MALVGGWRPIGRYVHVDICVVTVLYLCHAESLEVHNVNMDKMQRAKIDFDLSREMGTSAEKRTDAFCAKFPHGTSDWGTMACWFANAIEAGRDAASTPNKP